MFEKFLHFAPLLNALVPLITATAVLLTAAVIAHGVGSGSRKQGRFGGFLPFVATHQDNGVAPAAAIAHCQNVSPAFVRNGASSFCHKLLRNAGSAHPFIDALAAEKVHRVVAARAGPEAADREARLQR
jgi:hypothetical protein